MPRKCLIGTALVLLLALLLLFSLLVRRSGGPVGPAAARSGAAGSGAAPAAESPPAALPAPVDLARADRESDLFGTVRDPEGAPIAGAAVRSHLALETGRPLLRYFEAGSFSPLPPGPSTRTAADGTFSMRLAPGQIVHLIVAAEGYLDAMFVRAHAGERVDLVLHRPGSGSGIRLTVTNERHEPVSGAEVTAVAWRDARPGIVRRGRTDAAGAAAVSGLDEGLTRVHVVHPDHNPTAFTVFLPEKGYAEETLVLEAGPTVEGIVLDATTGAPLAGATVSVAVRDRVVRTGEDGRFRFRNFAGDYDQITATAPGYGRASTYVPFGRGVTLRLAPAMTAGGRLVDPSGRPVPNGTVHLTGWVEGGGTELFSTIDLFAASGEDGRFRLTGLRPNGRLTLTASAPGHGRALFAFEAQYLSGPDRDKDLGDLTLRPGRTLRGVVRDAGGRPFPGLSVSAEFTRGAATPLGSRPPRTIVRSPESRLATTDDLGRFGFADVAPGEYLLKTAPGRAMPARLVVRVEEDADPAPVELRIAATSPFAVRVLTPEGRPLPGARVTVQWIGDGTSATTDADGRITFSGIPEDLEDLELDVRPAAGPADPTIFRTTWTVARSSGGTTIRLRPVGWITGICVDPDGNPLPLVGIRVQTAGGELAGLTGMADRQGRFRLRCAAGGVVNLGFSALPCHPVTATLYSDRSWTARAMGIRAPRENLRIVLEELRSDVTMRVTVQGPGDAPVPGASVRAEGLSGVAAGITGADGRVVLEGVERGSIRFVVSPKPGTVPTDVIVPYCEVFDTRSRSDVLVRLAPTRIVTGVVYHHDGTPAAGVRISGQDPAGSGRPVLSDAEGKFRVVIAPRAGALVMANWLDPQGTAWIAREAAPPGTTRVELRLCRGLE